MSEADAVPEIPVEETELVESVVVPEGVPAVVIEDQADETPVVCVEGEVPSASVISNDTISHILERADGVRITASGSVLA